MVRHVLSKPILDEFPSRRSSHFIPKFQLQWRSVANALRLLTQPPASLSVLDRRRAHLLVWLLLVMILLTLTGLLFNPDR